MRVCVFGAGAVGGHIAAHLLAAGACETSVIARGAHLETIQRDGLRLIMGDRQVVARPVMATGSPDSLPAQDLVIVALKAHALPDAAAAIAGLLAPQGTALFVVNGIPWWWHQDLPGPQAHLPLLDPRGDLWRLLRTRALGGICLWSSEVVRPGAVQTTRDGGLVMGEPDGSRSARLGEASAMLRQAGLDVRESRDLRACLVAVIDEVSAVAHSCGWEVQTDVAALLDPARRPPAHRSSMLQDVLAARPLETEALLGQVVEFAHAKGVATPRCDTLLSLLRGLGNPPTR